MTTKKKPFGNHAPSRYITSQLPDAYELTVQFEMQRSKHRATQAVINSWGAKRRQLLSDAEHREKMDCIYPYEWGQDSGR